MSRRRHHLLAIDERILFGLIGLTLVVLLAVLIMGFVTRELGRRKLESVRQSMKLDGTYHTVEEIAAEPSEEALANGRALLGAIGELKAVENSGPPVDSGLAVMRFVEPGRAVPAVTEAAPVLDGAEDKRITWEELQKQVDKARPILTRIDAILKNPVAFEYDYRTFKSNDAFAVQPLLVWWRRDAVLKLRAGDREGAIVCMENLALISCLAGESSTLVATVMEMGMWTFGLQSLLWEVLQSESLTEADLIRLNEIARTPDSLKDVLRALEIEVAMMPYVYDQVKAAPKGLGAYSAIPTGVLGHETALEIRNALWPHLWADADQARNLAEWDKVIKGIRTLRTEKNYSAVIEQFDGLTRRFSNGDLWRFPVETSYSASNMVAGLLKSVIRLETIRHMILTAIALKRYHLKNQVYPEKLASLVPDYMPSVPMDCFDGGPLKYERLDSGEFLLYSVGDDRIDDKGDATPFQAKASLTAGKDYVWPRAQSSGGAGDH